nr:ScbA/BarX family gamma-butyrolactone biosynthesis protein [Streptomyces sp. YIM 130001]
MNRTASSTAILTPSDLDGGYAQLAHLHRTRAMDAFPVEWSRTGEDDFCVRAQWTSTHPFFPPVSGNRYDPLLVAETFRQAALLVLHASYGVPLDHKLLLSDLGYDCRMEHLVAEPGPTDVEVDVRFPVLKRRGGHLSYASIEFTLLRGGYEAATGLINTRMLSRPVYNRIRNGRTDDGCRAPEVPGIAPSIAGRAHDGDVLLAGTAQQNAWDLRVDTGHPTLFQRPNDHVPGMLLFEAGRQAAQAACAPERFVATSGHIAFHQYVEFDAPCQIQVSPMVTTAGDRTARILGSQGGELAFVSNFAGSRRF